jgi:hypothetical protein
MSIAVLHHHGLPVAAAGAAVLAVVTGAVVLGVVQDDANTALQAPPATGLTVHLQGSGHQSGDWDHAGTTSGGKTQPGLP